MELPVEIHNIIFNKLDISTYYNLILSNKYFNNILSIDEILQIKYRNYNNIDKYERCIIDGYVDGFNYLRKKYNFPFDYNFIYLKISYVDIKLFYIFIKEINVKNICNKTIELLFEYITNNKKKYDIIQHMYYNNTELINVLIQNKKNISFHSMTIIQYNNSMFMSSEINRFDKLLVYHFILKNDINECKNIIKISMNNILDCSLTQFIIEYMINKELYNFIYQHIIMDKMTSKYWNIDFNNVYNDINDKYKIMMIMSYIKSESDKKN